MLTEEDLKSLPEERSHEIEVVEFVPSEQIDEIMFDRSYFLAPDKAAAKPYALLRRALEVEVPVHRRGAAARCAPATRPGPCDLATKS